MTAVLEPDVRTIPDEVLAAFEEDKKYFPTASQQFMFYDKYSRYNYDLGRRETWVESVTRTIDFMRELSSNKLGEDVYNRLFQSLVNMRATPSMRALSTSGEYARSQNLAIFNCSYVPVDSLSSFCEALLISMSGCGVGFSVESQYVSLLPEVAPQSNNAPLYYEIEDSTDGWINALRTGLECWFSGNDVEYEYFYIRRAGLPLRTKGGRASGPGPLKTMLDNIRAIVLGASGRALNTLEAHDIMCNVGQAAVAGGVRRTAMISLFDWNDQLMRHAKDGYDFPSIRWNANNSAVWPDDIEDEDIIQQMKDMNHGGNGEPGIFSRANARAGRPLRRGDAVFGTNPCGEIILRPRQLCNLSIAVARAGDTVADLRDKVEVAAIFGTIQACAEYFPGLPDTWAINQREERLLGVDILGQLDCELARNPAVQSMLANVAVATNAHYADLLGINRAAAVTCVKPGGNSSQLFNTNSGLKDRHSPYYIRNMRVSAASPVSAALKAANVPLQPENGQTYENASTWVVPFPVASPDGAVVDMTAMEQLEYWLQVKQHWTEHNPSATINYTPQEFDDVVQWVVDHKDVIGGLSFLPKYDSNYSLMPYTTISRAEYDQAVVDFPADIDFSVIYQYELEDMTTATQELACMAGACDANL